MVSKIAAMQEAASRSSTETTVEVNTKCIEETAQVVDNTDISDKKTSAVVENVATTSSCANISATPNNPENQPDWQWGSSSETNKLCSNEGCNKDGTNDGNHLNDSVKSHPYLIKSGHAKTHSIIINLDDKSRFTEEVTV